MLRRDVRINAVIADVEIFPKMKYGKEIDIVLRARKSNTDMLNIIDALAYNTADKFQDAFDIALEMDRQNLVKLLYSNFDAGKVIVEFTLLGKK